MCPEEEGVGPLLSGGDDCSGPMSNIAIMSGRTFLEQGQGSIEEKAGKFLFRQALYLLKSVAVGGRHFLDTRKSDA